MNLLAIPLLCVEIGKPQTQVFHNCIISMDGKNAKQANEQWSLLFLFFAKY